MKRFFLFVILLTVTLGATPDKITWVAIGDSITYLNDHLDETGHRVTKGYLTLVSERYPHVTYINKGYNGWTSVGIAEQIEKLGLIPADVYTVFLGTNDWWQGKPVGTLADYEQNTGTGTISGAFRIIISKLRQLNPNAQIILMTPIQRGDFVYLTNFKNNAFGSYQPKNGQTLEQVADAIRAIGKHEHLAVADLYHKSGITPKNVVRYKRLRDPATGTFRNYTWPAYTSVPFDPAKDEYPYPTDAIDLTYDGLHPSDAGYERITKVLVKKWKGLK